MPCIKGYHTLTVAPDKTYVIIQSLAKEQE